ncbi:MAG: hypothetical protein FJ054_11640 [Cyanobacteria bacterium M_surface_10_m2_119]|nr:hypothetical protein [Cyanobacteria bacterium M_surface_10_m2_119]
MARPVLRLHLHGPWLVAAMLVLLALILLWRDRFSPTSASWGLLGSAAICFSIGCVCRTSWQLARRPTQPPSPL